MCDDDHGNGVPRRALFVTGAAAALTLGSVTFASGADAAGGPGTPASGTETRTVRGTLPTGSPDFVYLPVEVPRGVREIKVAYTYEKPSVPAGTAGNALDIGIFDERGTDLGGRGFRGWSGGARSEFFLRGDDATPGYLPGPVRPGTWHIALGPYTVAPQGLPYEVTVTLTYGEQAVTPKPVYPPARARGRGRAWYRGDCHLHSWYSDGRRTPAEIAALARAAGLDFINSSDHNTHSSHPHWADQAGDDLLILLGEEITTRNGHVLALGTDPGTFVDWRYRARDNRFGKFARRVREAGGLVVPAHPHATCIGCGWKFGFGEADAVEVWNGPYTPDDEIALADWDNMLVAAVRSGGHGERGWLPAMGNSDAHRDPDQVGTPQTVVLADDLTREAVQAGLRAGRSYVAESQLVSLAFTASGARGEHAGIGERLKVAPDTPVTVRVEAAGAPRCTVRLVTDEGLLFTSDPLPVSGAGTVEWRTTAAYAAYVRAELRHEAAAGPLPGALAAFTNPIFLGDAR
ncbi:MULTISPECIES: CehA/McbA family metallohydrolase [unclassified Streptomyces]|uniref:CehA/McbA family metallohydrolase n=1 Tax=unclassified Streptomyces TaxID=2593676 RepID=UPI00225630FD|nr:CehA/McbA family metallohydrolase [Streptomyces sp. NBC_00340]MCX5132577.1 CehA/McbA family metallohydrolase [Streptomyces sp. NBC_00340]